MAKLCSAYVTLLLLFTSGALMVMVAGDICRDDFGVCQGDCNTSCSINRPNGQGICSSNNGSAQTNCYCFYECKPKRYGVCEVVLTAMENCNDSQCKSDCVAKYQNQAVDGFCYNAGVVPVSGYCHCKYTCPASGANKFLALEKGNSFGMFLVMMMIITHQII